jgi:hypothetical protein
MSAILDNAYTLRLDGLHYLTLQDLRRGVEQFGEILHIHHYSRSSESIVIFKDREAAEAASLALGGGEDNFSNPDNPLHNSDFEAERQRLREEYRARGQAIAFSARSALAEPLFDGDMEFSEFYWDNVTSVVDGTP